MLSSVVTLTPLYLVQKRSSRCECHLLYLIYYISMPFRSGPWSDKDADLIRVHRAKAIAEMSTVQLGQGGLILLAALRGSDYSLVSCLHGGLVSTPHVRVQGVKGCGIEIAHALARCGFGEELLHFVRQGKEPYQLWFATWIQKLQEELQTNSRGFLSQRAFAVARRLPTEFPPLEIIKLHVTPVVNDRQSVSAIQVPRCTPDLSLLVAMC